ncbi:SixA phosphatase family protein [Zhihengliuella flava]|uniref:Phosphohistidine phosphatase n=1 Tax=Zhihengliuella flava TaxID=1285193 RepID=A0A931GJC0_9MICC|nr:histidine phosphatase family protein [Zhihengliuella flava]MBG6085176.1 phosphohistidine phosphatase [Zhihengliuella flava]
MSEHHIKRLLLLRHAKADFPFGVEDHSRPLAASGDAAAPLAGRWMVEHSVVPDYIVTSDALRTRSTCAWVSSELGEAGPTPYVDSRVYGANAAQLISLINETPESVRTLLVIGHLPTVQDVAMRLASVESDEPAVMDLAMDYPPLGLTVLDFEVPWAELDGRDARVSTFVVPRP